MTDIPGTNVPAITFGTTGFVGPSAPLILAGVQTDINAAFGRTLNYQLNTPQGQIASSQAALIFNTNSIFTYYTQQVDPAYATGRMQDAIGRIYFIERIPSAPTVLQLQCFGEDGVTIPEESTVQDTAGNLYSSLAAGTIPVGVGSVTIAFSAINSGPTSVPETVSIYQTVAGWDSATVSSGVVGRDVESRQEFEERRALTVAGNSFGAAGSIAGAVSEVDGVTDFYVYDNASNTSTTLQGVTIAKNSIYVAVTGGTDEDVAQAILSKKAPGCSYTGNTTVTAFDSNPLYDNPIPYDVSFERPEDLEIIFTVRMSDNASVPADGAAQIQDAIVDAFTGGDGGPRARIGGKIFASRFYAPVALLGSWAQIISIFIGSAATPNATVTGSITGSVMTVTAVSAGTLAVGQTVTGTGILAGTKIATLGTGVGGTGTYNLNQVNTFLSGVIKTVTPALNEITVDIDLQPVIDADNITVLLV